IDAPFLGLAADEAHSALRVLERARGRQSLLLPGPPWAAVFDDDAGHPDGVEPLGDFLAMNVPIEGMVAAAWTDQHGDARVLVLRRPINRQRRLGDVGDEHARFAGDAIRLVRCRLERRSFEYFLFANRGGIVAGWHLIRPEVDDEGWIGRDGRIQSRQAD